MKSAVELCARAVAGWHSSWLNALGLRWEQDREAWRALDPPPHIYFAAITLRADTPAKAVTAGPGSICDSWQTLDLERAGYRVFRQEPWFHRPAGPLHEAAPADLEVARVATEAEVEEFELVSVRGFENEKATIAPGTFHPPTILDDPAMAMFVGRVDGRTIGAAMGYLTDEAVGVFGVTTVASARRRGYGAALTRAAMMAETGLPAILAPSKEGEGVYLKLGFRPAGALSIWVKEDRVP